MFAVTSATSGTSQINNILVIKDKHDKPLRRYDVILSLQLRSCALWIQPSQQQYRKILTARDLRAAVDNPNLGPQLIQEHHRALRLGKGSRHLPHGLSRATSEDGRYHRLQRHEQNITQNPVF